MNYDKRTRRDGPPVEALGWYDPKAQAADKQFSIKADRVAHWFGKGAHVSDTVRSFLMRRGIDVPKVKTSRDRVAKDAGRRERAAAKRTGAKSAKKA